MEQSSVIPYGKQAAIEDDIQAVVAVLKSDFWTQGSKVKEFEDKFAAYVGAKYAVAVTNGTAALHLCTLALGVNSDSHVISTPLSFVASTNCVLYCGGNVEFADIDAETYNLDPRKVEALLNTNPGKYSGIIAVDFAGLPADLPALSALAKKHNLWLIEDASHSPGATFKHQGGNYRAGDGHFADLAVFSFHPVKHIASGEGGMITTNDEALYKKLLLLRTHGITKDSALITRKDDGGWNQEMQALGYNYRISDILCALGASQLHRADDSFQRRQQVAARYDRELKDLPIKLPLSSEQLKNAYHLYVIQTDQRRKLYDFLRTKNIFAQVHYLPIHQQPYYIKKYGPQNFPVVDAYYERCLSIPMYHSMSETEQSRVIHSIREFFGKT